jgi:hypothetical protein
MKTKNNDATFLLRKRGNKIAKNMVNHLLDMRAEQATFLIKINNVDVWLTTKIKSIRHCTPKICPLGEKGWISCPMSGHTYCGYDVNDD